MGGEKGVGRLPCCLVARLPSCLVLNFGHKKKHSFSRSKYCWVYKIFNPANKATWQPQNPTMCGRASLNKKPKELEKRYAAKFVQTKLELPSILPTYNVAPTHLHPVQTNEVNFPLRFFKWGLIPFWAKDAKIGSKLINARSEPILEKPAFRSIHKKRCLVPFDGFYEWKKVGKTRIPYRIILPETEIFSVAGIWDVWKNPNDDLVYSFTILTQPPNDLMKGIHDRMPAILYQEQEKIWLDNNLLIKEILKIINPYPSELMKSYRVSDAVNKVSNNTPQLLEEIPDFQQGSLF